MKPNPLLPCFEKLNWAKPKIKELDAEIRSFFKANPYEVISEVDPKKVEEIWKFRIPEPLPASLAINAGAIINNIRSPLDQMVCALGAEATGSEGSFAFPFGDLKSEFIGRLNRQAKLGLPRDAIALIRKTNAYRRGNLCLWALNHLDSRNKHRPRLIPFTIRAASRASYLMCKDGQVLVMGSRSGQHLVAERRVTADEFLRATLKSASTIQRSPTPPFTRASRPYTTEPVNYMLFRVSRARSPKDSFEFLTTTPGTKIKTDFEPALDVAVDGVRGLEQTPLVSLLDEMLNLVEGLLLTFERRFFS